MKPGALAMRKYNAKNFYLSTLIQTQFRSMGDQLDHRS